MKALIAALALASSACASVPRVQPAPPKQEDIMAKLRSSTVGLVNDDTIAKGSAYCSGVWVSASSILTAYHCIDGSEIGASVWYSVYSDVYQPSSPKKHAQITKRPALLYDVDKRHDLALLRAGRAPLGHATADLTRSPAMQGQRVHVMGQSDGFFWWSYSSGDVAAVRTIGGDVKLDPEMIFIQTTAPITHGNSGGGMFNNQGELLGICHAFYPAGQNLNIFVDTSYLKALLDAQGAAL